jgi:hypothetical protein
VASAVRVGDAGGLSVPVSWWVGLVPSPGLDDEDDFASIPIIPGHVWPSQISIRAHAPVSYVRREQREAVSPV